MKRISPISCLPVELLRLILDVVLEVQDSALTNPRSRFNRRRSSDYLLVSKLWLDVGLSLLHRTVILRSSAQVHALLITLIERPELGRLIRNVRVEEGAFYPGLEKVTERLKEVKTVVISLAVYTSTDAQTACLALDHLAPTKLVLHDLGSTITRNRSMDKVVEGMCRMIVRSQNLEIFEWHVEWRKKVFTLHRSQCFADALLRVPKLRIAAVTSSHNAATVNFLETLVNKSEVERVCIIDCPKRMREKISGFALTTPGASERVEFYNHFYQVYVTEKIKQRPPVNCIQSLPLLPNGIIKRIVELVLTSLELLNEGLFSDGITDTGFPEFEKTLCSLMRVSKLFKSFVQPLRFLQVSMPDFYTGTRFLKDVMGESRCDASVPTRGVYINSSQSVITDEERQAGDVVLKALCGMIHLTELSIPATPGVVRLLAHHLGHSLIKLDLCLESSSHSTPDATEDSESDALLPEYFSGFHALEVLWIRCSHDFPKLTSSRFDKSGILNDSGPTQKVIFERLRVLIIQDYEDGKVFDLVDSWNLSTIRRLSFAGSVSTCSQAEVARVYNIIDSILKDSSTETLALGHGAVNPDIEILIRSLAIRTLSKVELCFSREGSSKDDRVTIVPFFKCLYGALKALPGGSLSLKEIQIKSLFKWPYTHAEIQRSIWPKCIDPLIREHGISVTNYKGIPWRPRLRIERNIMI